MALDAAGMGTFVWYANEDRTEPDARMLELFALPPGGLLSLATALTSMIHPGDRQRYGDAVAAALDPAGSHQLSQEIRVNRGDGSHRWVSVTARAFFEGTPPRADRLVGVAADITRRREIEDELRSSEDRRAFLLDLTDRLRPVTDPVAVQELAVAALGARLAVSRAMYLEVTGGPGGDVYAVERDYHAPGIASAVGRYRADEFGATLFDELRAGRTLTVADVATDPRLTAGERQSYQRIGTAAFAAVPLVKDGRHAAALVLHEATRRPWPADDVALVEEVAERTWAAVERAKAEAALRASEARVLAEQTEAREREHQIALQLQRALLPARTIAPAGVAIAARYEAGSTTLEVGGDWYDTVALPDGRIALTVGDVVGHGLAAATSMGKMRVAMSALAPHAAGPGSLLTYLDGFAAANDEIPFATACYAVLDPVTRELRHASAGHPPMLVVTGDRRTRWLAAGGSAPITGRDLGTRPEATETLEPGALLVLFSDGLIERRHEPITTGLDRLARAAVALGDAPVDRMCDGLLTALGVAEHRNDDVVVLCLRVPFRPTEEATR